MTRASVLRLLLWAAASGGPVRAQNPTAPAVVNDVSLPRASFSHVWIEDLVAQGRDHRILFEALIRAAAGGSAAALDSILAAASWIGADSAAPILSYPMVLAGLMETAGDQRFHEALMRLDPETRYRALVQLARSGLVTADFFPLTQALDSTVRSAWPAPRGDSIADARSVDRQPEPVRGTCGLPMFPERLRRDGWDGRVVLEFVIGVDGRVEPASMRRLAATHPLFVAGAERALRSCRFLPARQGERAVRVRALQPVSFRQLAR